jgi:RNA-binding protein
MPSQPSQSKSEPKGMILSAAKRKELRAAAHALQPIVHVGHGGVREPVVAAVLRALSDHELIKVRLHEPEDKRAMAESLASETGAALCGLVGHTVILYKAKPKPKPKREEAAPRRAARSSPRKAGGAKRAPRQQTRKKAQTSRRRVSSR